MSIVSVAGSERFAFTHGSRVGPFKVGNWVYFALLGGWNNLSAADHVLEVWGSENGGAFTELDSVNHKLAEWSGFYSFEHTAYLVGTKIYIAYVEWDFSAVEWTPQTLLAIFDCSTNLWEPTVIRAGPAVQNLSGTTDSLYPVIVQMVARAADDIVCVTSGQRSGGGSVPRPWVGYYDGAAWDLASLVTGSGYEMAAVGGTNLRCWAVDTILGASGLVHMFFVEFNMTTAALKLKMQTISAANVIGSITEVADIFNPGLPIGGSAAFQTSILSSVGFASYDSVSGTLAIPYFNTSHNVAVGLGNSEDAPTWSSETVDTTTTVYPSDHLSGSLVRFALSTAHWRSGTLEVYWLDDSRNFQKSRRTAPVTWTVPAEYIADSDGRLVFEVPQPSGYDGAGFDRWSATEHQMYQSLVTSRPPKYFAQ